VVNAVLKTVIKKLAAFENYKTLTEETEMTVTNTFMAIFVNTALITLILNGKVFNVAPAYEIGHGALGDDFNAPDSGF